MAYPWSEKQMHVLSSLMWINDDDGMQGGVGLDVSASDERSDCDPAWVVNSLGPSHRLGSRGFPSIFGLASPDLARFSFRAFLIWQRVACRWIVGYRNVVCLSDASRGRLGPGGLVYCDLQNPVQSQNRELAEVTQSSRSDLSVLMSMVVFY